MHQNQFLSLSVIDHPTPSLSWMSFSTYYYFQRLKFPLHHPTLTTLPWLPTGFGSQDGDGGCLPSSFWLQRAEGTSCGVSLAS